MTDSSTPSAIVARVFADAAELMLTVRQGMAQDVAELATDLALALGGDCKLVTFGNGGSAADAQHFAAELTGRFVAPRGPLSAVALTTDTSALTAIANDFGYDEVFARQARGLCRPGDVAVGISTSGRSPSVVAGIAAAKERGAKTWGLCGGDGGSLAQVADRAIVVPSSSSARVQEVHIAVIHAVCAVLDELLAREPDSDDGDG